MTELQMKSEIENAKKPIDHLSKWYQEISCRRMIDSILAYQCAGFKSANKVWEHEQKSYHNYLQQYVDKLGLERVLELINEQIDSIYCVLIDVSEDSEGVSYNSIVYNDESYRIWQITRKLVNNRVVAMGGMRKAQEQKLFSKLNALKQALKDLNDLYSDVDLDIDINDYFAKANITFTNKSFDEFNEEIIDYIDSIID